MRPLTHKCGAVFLAMATVAGLGSSVCGEEIENRGRQFIGIDSISGFERDASSGSTGTLYTSPILTSRIAFNEMVVSWDIETPGESCVTIEAKALYPEKATRFYQLGVWSAHSKLHPRHSVRDQKDGSGDVATDTLGLTVPANRFQLRLRLTNEGDAEPRIKFLAVSLADTHYASPALPPQKTAWDKVLPVEERTQMAYPNGNTLCSPTTLSMLLAFWGNSLKRPELNCTVPEVADAVYDEGWHAAGNWPFNTAFAGSFRGMRAYVTRMSDVSELEQWIALGIPVGMSVDYDRLRAKGPGPNGHLVVCVGFTKDGDAVINDPGTSKHVRKTFPRKNLEEAWACSKNTVYLVYPENANIPRDRFGHWDSPLTRVRLPAQIAPALGPR